MLNKARHQLIMGQILKDIYTDQSIAPLLGFKGGSCAYFFYGLPRFSVDLDFDLLAPEKKRQEFLFEKIETILKKYGTIKDKQIKHSTILFHLSYGQDDHNIKVEISTRTAPFLCANCFELKKYLGISMLVARQDYLFAGKLAALTMRKRLAMRDVYDLYFFAKNHWDINAEALTGFTGKTAKKYLPDCVAAIEKIKDSQILQGLGELMDEQEKKWLKKNLKPETAFLLKNYLAMMRSGK